MSRKYQVEHFGTGGEFIESHRVTASNVKSAIHQIHDDACEANGWIWEPRDGSYFNPKTMHEVRALPAVEVDSYNNV